MSDRFKDAMLKIARDAFPWIGYAGTFEYEVFAASPPLYDLRPTVPASGLPIFGGNLPPTPPTPVKPGVPGVTSELAVGSLVYVTFINCDAARPIIVAVAGPGDAGFTPVSIAIDASGSISIGTSTLVHVGGTEVAIPGTFSGRFVRYGDFIKVGTGVAASNGAAGLIDVTLGTVSRAGS
jgi:hypothetical protein